MKRAIGSMGGGGNDYTVRSIPGTKNRRPDCSDRRLC